MKQTYSVQIQSKSQDTKVSSLSMTTMKSSWKSKDDSLMQLICERNYEKPLHQENPVTVFDIPRFVAPLVPVAMTTTDYNQFPPLHSGLKSPPIAIMARSQEQTMIHTFINCQVPFIFGHSKCPAFIIEDDSDLTVY